jgi:hypothetical protein
LKAQAAEELAAANNAFEIERLKYESEINRLKGIINKNSSNSSKPPSTNGYKKVVQNNRKAASPADKGHKGHGLKLY